LPRGGATRVGAAGVAGTCLTETDGFWRDRDDLPILDSQRDWLLLLLRGSHNVFSQRYGEKNSLECSPKLRHGIKGPATLNGAELCWCGRDHCKPIWASPARRLSTVYVITPGRDLRYSALSVATVTSESAHRFQILTANQTEAAFLGL
jgi:hypothetical protein